MKEPERKPDLEALAREALAWDSRDKTPNGWVPVAKTEPRVDDSEEEGDAPGTRQPHL